MSSWKWMKYVRSQTLNMIPGLVPWAMCSLHGQVLDCKLLATVNILRAHRQCSIKNREWIRSIIYGCFKCCWVSFIKGFRAIYCPWSTCTSSVIASGVTSDWHATTKSGIWPCDFCVRFDHLGQPICYFASELHCSESIFCPCILLSYKPIALM